MLKKKKLIYTKIPSFELRTNPDSLTVHKKKPSCGNVWQLFINFWIRNLRQYPEGGRGGSFGFEPSPLKKISFCSIRKKSNKTTYKEIINAFCSLFCTPSNRQKS